MSGTKGPRVRKYSPKRELGQKERRRLIQLVVCLAVFAVLLAGHRVFPEKMETLRGRIAAVLHEDTDFKAAFAQLGRSISQGEPADKSLSDLWVAVFGGVEGEEVEAYAPMTGPRYGFTTQRAILSGDVTAAGILTRLGYEEGAPPEEAPAKEEPQVQATPEPVSESDPEPSPEPTPTPRPYDGPALPANTSMDYYDLGLGETVMPVAGVLTSGFGYRDHPIDGEYKFHYGVDLAADTGTDILAFAAGTVDYIGESEAYGLYIQLDHGGGVKSFYAHCSLLCADQGDTVSVGEKIAEVGATGNVTGPHLHLEIKVDGVYHDPCYYVDLS